VKTFLNLFFALFFLLSLWACKKDSNLLGVDVQPPGDALTATFSETAPVFAFTQKYDSILSYPSRYKYLGINNDPYFGTTEVGLYLTANIPDGKTYVSFGDDARLSSSEIILTAFNLGVSYIGSASAQVSYSIYPLLSAFDRTKLYYTNVDKLYNNNVILGAFTGSYSALDGKVVLRIPMDKNFANAVLTNPQYLYNNDAFLATYKGFYIKCSLNNDAGIITKFDLKDPLSGFYLYYQNGTPSATKTDKSFKFVFGLSDQEQITAFNTVKHSFTGASTSLLQQVVNKDTNSGKENLFLKGMGVSKVKLYIPSLKNYSDSFKIAVNRAELIFNLDPAFAQGLGYLPPAKLCLLPLDSLGRETFAIDQKSSSDLARYNGNYDVIERRYVFNIARHAQAIAAGKIKNYGFYLVVANSDFLSSYNNVYVENSTALFYLKRDEYIERVVLAGSANSSLKPVFKLSYIKLKYD
jgi:hypothetical protein